jgi:hypothetical protein
LPLLSAGAIATVATAATAALVPSAATTANAAYFSAAGSAASMFPPTLPLFLSLLRATASVSIATCTVGVQVLWINLDSYKEYEKHYGKKRGLLSSSLGDKTVAGSNRSCISSASFGIQIIYLEEP